MHNTCPYNSFMHRHPRGGETREGRYSFEQPMGRAKRSGVTLGGGDADGATSLRRSERVFSSACRTYDPVLQGRGGI